MEINLNIFQFVLIFFFLCDCGIQFAGIYVLYYMKQLRHHQNIILINVSIYHACFAVVCIYNVTGHAVQIHKKHIDDTMVIAFTRGALGAIYPLLMHYITVDRMLEVYLHLMYPIYFKKKRIQLIIVILWIVSIGFGTINSYLHRYNRTSYFTTPKYMFAVLSFSVLFTFVIVYTYLYQKWKLFRNQIPKLRNGASIKSKRFVIPFLVVFIFIFFETLGSALSILQNTLKLSVRYHHALRYFTLTLFSCGAISDVFIYVFLQRNVQRKLRRFIRKNKRSSQGCIRRRSNACSENSRISSIYSDGNSGHLTWVGHIKDKETCH